MSYKRFFVIFTLILSIWLNCSKPKKELGITPAKYSRSALSNIHDLQAEIKNVNIQLDEFDSKIDNLSRQKRDIDKNTFSIQNLLNGNDIKADSENNVLKDTQIEKNLESIEDIESWLSKFENDYRIKDFIKLKDRYGKIETYMNRLKKTNNIKEFLIELNIDFKGEIEIPLETKEDIEKALLTLKEKYKNQLDEVKKDRENEIQKKQNKIDTLLATNKKLLNEKIDLDEKRKNYRKEILVDESKKASFQKQIDSLQTRYDSVQIILISYEIEQIFRNSEDKGLNPDSLKQKMTYLISLHDSLAVNLAKTDRNTIKYILTKIKEQFAQVKSLIDEYENLRNTVITLFQGGIFSQYFQMSKNELISNDPKVQIKIKVFKTMMPQIIKFLEAYNEYKIYIDGHADRTPWNRDKYGNMRLSKERAEFTRDQFVKAGVAPDRIIVDWYGEFHNTKKIPVKSTSKEQVVDRRVDLRIIGGKSDSTDEKINYMDFRNNYPIVYGSEKKLFKHESGFWIEHGFENTNYPIMNIVYEDSSYTKLITENKIASQILDRHPSILYPQGEFELGNQVKFILSHKGKKYRVIITATQNENI